MCTLPLLLLYYKNWTLFTVHASTLLLLQENWNFYSAHIIPPTPFGKIEHFYSADITPPTPLGKVEHFLQCRHHPSSSFRKSWTLFTVQTSPLPLLQENWTIFSSSRRHLLSFPKLNLLEQFFRFCPPLLTRLGRFWTYAKHNKKYRINFQFCPPFWAYLLRKESWSAQQHFLTWYFYNRWK